MSCRLISHFEVIGHLHESNLRVNELGKPDYCTSMKLPGDSLTCLTDTEPQGYPTKGEAYQRSVTSDVVNLGDIKRHANNARDCHSQKLLIDVKFQWCLNCNCIGSEVVD